jgi:hypothetical protein
MMYGVAMVMRSGGVYKRVLHRGGVGKRCLYLELYPMESDRN